MPQQPVPIPVPVMAKPRWKMPCVWITAVLFLLGSAITSDIIPPQFHHTAVWLLVSLGAVGSMFFPGLVVPQALQSQMPTAVHGADGSISFPASTAAAGGQSEKKPE